ncbi:MAG: amidophosphoribosyltransferase, partial [Planctomycetota bacterium]|nr:amidophosphoribosyltransferase [Planctomycetota bacterium]
MSDFIGHECGIALVRLRQPLSFYRDRYGDPAWGLRRLYLLMEKQHNRGQDGAGMAVVKANMHPGEKYLLRLRSDKHNALERIFDVVMRGVRNTSARSWAAKDEHAMKRRAEFLGELYLGHLRYGTHSQYKLANCHPLVRKSNTASRNLAVAGNFNMTNAADLFAQLVEYGLNPVGESDTQVILERIGYFLDREHEFLQATMGPESFRGLAGRLLAEEVSRELDLVRVLRKAAEGWDGGYAFAGVLGNGDAFACRDGAGIRPVFFHVDEEVVAVASERAALANVFDVEPEAIEPVRPGHVLVVKADGRMRHEPFTEALELRQCTFERIYFSRGNDPDIYRQRKALGRFLAPRVLEAIEDDVEHAVFSFIPNTAESAYLGLVDEIDERTRRRTAEHIWQKIRAGQAEPSDLDRLLNGHVRAEKIAHKDQRLRTFITHDEARRDLVTHIYDITRGVVRPDDTLVVLDDSIVRGT